MDIYKYVNRRPYQITVGTIVIPPYGEYISYNQTVPELDRVDGVLVDKHFNAAFRQEPVEFNYYQPVISHEKGDGIKLNADNPQFGWHDLLSPITIDSGAATGKPTFSTLVGSIKKYQFKVGDHSFHQFHLPHDYLPGSDLYIHVHWTHNSAEVLGGQTTWSFEATYAKGYNQSQFNTPVTTTVTQQVVTTPLTHQIAETKLSTLGGTGGLLDSAAIETDGLVLVKTTLQASTLAVDPFMMYCDIHYQSTGRPTKNKNADFWT